MKICRTYHKLSLLIGLALSVFTGFCMGQDDPGQLLEWYLETGSADYAERIREEFPGTPQERFCNAWEYLGANNQMAREQAKLLVESYPGFAPGHFLMGTILSEGFEDYAEAVAWFDRGLEIDPEFMWSYLNRGIARIGMKDYTAAKEDFEQVLKLKRGFARGFLLRGVANYGLGNQEAMLADFEIGLQLDFMALSRIPGNLANDAVDRAIEVSQENAIFYYARGYARFVKGNYRAASSDFSKCTELVPGSSDFYKYSGASRMHLDDFEEAQKDLNYALSVNPDDPETYYFLGILMNDFLKQPAMAREYLNHAIRLDGSKGIYYFERARADYKLMNYEAARDDVNLALQLEHRKGDFYALRGNVKIKLGSPPEEACQDFKKAQEWGTAQNLKRIMKKSCPD